ncbi:MAG: tetratricopeptide repeat protein, partial [Desulfobacteraceae bacterium]|nr:tetratricopeptide repeat protein [Desulfobacteraceae bacterium]
TRITVLQRKGFAVPVQDVVVRTVPAFQLGDAAVLDDDDEMLHRICSQLKADVFLSTYYTRAPGVLNVVMVHDLIPEMMGLDLSQPEWLAKQRVIETADGYINVSRATRNDLVSCYPQIANRPMIVVRNGLDQHFRQPHADDIARLRNKFNLQKPYVLLAGNRHEYKNGVAFLNALTKLPSSAKPMVLCVGGETRLSSKEKEIQKDLEVKYAGSLKDADLAAAYGGAEALCVPSLYEGFGLPVIEALACGCPVIAHASNAVAEIGGDAIRYANLASTSEIFEALQDVRSKEYRRSSIEKGLRHAAGFDWDDTSKSISAFITESIKTKSIILTAIVSTYNAARFIHGCLEDLEEQTIADRLEIIVVDSASEQDEAAIVRGFQKRYPNIKYIRTPIREKLYRAWNRGIKFAIGKYITNANTDDRHRQDAFEQMTGVMEKDENVALVYADVLVTREANETFRNCIPNRMFHRYAWDRRKLLEKGCFIGPQPVWRKSVHDEYGYFDERYTVASDFEFWLRISQTNEFYHISRPMGLYMERADSIEHSNEARKQQELQEIFPLYRKADKENKIIGRQNEAGKIIPFEICRDSQGHASAGTGPDEMIETSDKKPEPGGQSMISPQTIIKAIEHLLDSGHKEAAGWAMGKLVVDYPNDARLHTAKAVLAYDQGEMQMALDHFQRALAMEPENVLYLKNLADFYYVHQKDAQGALALYEKILDAEPNHIETLLLAGHVSISLHRYNQAQQYYQRVQQLDPDNSEVRPFLEKMNHAAQSKNSATISVEELYAASKAKAQEGDPQGAMVLIEQLLTQDDSHALAHNDLAVLNYEAGNMQAAQTHYEKAVALMPENETFQKNLADFYLVELGDHQRAMQTYVQVLKLNPQDVETLLGCGQVCMALGQVSDARDFFDTVLQLEPWNDHAQQLLRQLDQSSGDTITAVPATGLYEQAQAKAATGDRGPSTT